MGGEHRRHRADTSSSAAASSLVVEAAASAFAEVTAEPMLDRSVAAEAISSGAVTTYDMASSSHPVPAEILYRRSTQHLGFHAQLDPPTR
jgi:hypothetical protein